MRICIYGAGATGGHFAVRLALAGHDVSVVARGAHLDAIRTNGLTLRSGDDVLNAKVAASDNAKDFSAQDVVIVATKATALPSIASQIAPVIGKDSIVVFPQNGMPWWYPVGLPANMPVPPKLPLFELADPFLAAMRADQVIGGSIYSANEVEAPGVVRNSSPEHNRMDVGVLSGDDNDVVRGFRIALEQADILSPAPDDIRTVIWRKLLTNMSGSALALATQSPSSTVQADEGLKEIHRRITREGLAIAAAHGYPLAEQPASARKAMSPRNHKPSLLQDYEQGRPMEIAEIVLAPVAFARAANLATPSLDAVAAIVTKMARDRGLVPDALKGPALLV